MKISLKNKVVIITGASKGIGRESAKLFIESGANVVMNSRNLTDLEEAKQLIGGTDENTLLVEADISDLNNCEKLVSSTIEKYGRIDVLVNNAAQFGSYKLENLEIKDFDRIMNANIRAVVYLTKLVSVHMVEKQSGTIINISSTAGKRGYLGGIAYATSKFAMNGFTECIAKELRPSNIRVVTISPSSVDTRDVPESEIKESGKGVYMRMEDVAETIFLSAALPQRVMLKDVEIWGTNP